MSLDSRRLHCRGCHPSADNRMKVGRVIGAADERTGGDMLKSLFARDLAVKFELLRRDEFHHWQMVRCRTQILAHGQNLAANLTQIVHRLKNFRLGFAEPEHDPAFGYNSAASER